MGPREAGSGQSGGRVGPSLGGEWGWACIGHGYLATRIGQVGPRGAESGPSRAELVLSGVECGVGLGFGIQGRGWAMIGTWLQG